MTEPGRDRIATTVHVDDADRAQVITDHGLLAEVLEELKRRGLDPVVINNSLNARGEPIVDAVAAANTIDIDFRALDDGLLDRR